jgi:hypothetical protein
MEAIGTLAQPGWLLAGLMTLLPIGSYVAGWKTLWPSHYTEEEVQAAVQQAQQTAVQQAQDAAIAQAKSTNT